MQHSANMNRRSLICSGFSVHLTDADDIAWAQASAVIQQDKHGAWYHTQITDRDRNVRRNFWKPDTGRHPNSL